MIHYNLFLFLPQLGRICNRISCWNFDPGQTHRICIRKAKRTPEKFEIEGIVVTRDPAPFEPR